MKVYLSILLAFACTLFAGCGASTLPKPNSPKTAGVEALITYGLAAHVANQYLSLPLCTNPLTVVPCKTAAIAASLKKADEAAYNAAVAADNAANAGDGNVQQKAQDTLADLKKANADASKSNGGKQ